MENANEQKPASVNQIKTNKDNVSKTANILIGNTQGSFNGGHCRPIFHKKIMAGEKHYGMRLKTNIQMLTPLTPAYQRLKIVFDTYFVPDRRVWTNALDFYAQRGGTSVEKIQEAPNIGGKYMPTITSIESANKFTNITNTTDWKNAWISSYIPRISYLKENQVGVDPASEALPIMPSRSILPMRGFIAIYNDFLRNKEYDEEIQEYKTDEVSNAEWQSYMPTLENRQWIRAKRPDSYYTNFRTELQGFETAFPPEDMSADVAGMNWLNWENQLAKSRTEAENAQKNTWDILAEQGGTKTLSEGLVQHIGRKVHNLNYSAITQTSYNMNEQIQERFRVMGQQGAFSYTELDIPLYGAKEFIEPGYIHVIATVQADTMFEKAWDRLELHSKPLDFYNPDLMEEKKDVLYDIELGAQKWNNNEIYNILGFKRKFSEYFKMQNITFGDLYNESYYMSTQDQNAQEMKYNAGFRSGQKSTYTFTESTGFYQYDAGGADYSASKNHWLDYTDLMINKNLAIKEKNEKGQAVGRTDVYIPKNDQILLVGQFACIAELPIDSSIANDHIKWGSH